DPNLIGMQAANLESVRLVGKLQTWSAVVLSRDLAALESARSAVRESPHVARTESILQAYDNLQWLRDHEQELPAIQWAPPAPVHPRELDLSTLPLALKGHFVAADGTYALYVYPVGNLWTHANLAAFVTDVEARLKNVSGERTLTGIAPNIFHATASIRRSFR